MADFCTCCGAELREGATFCTNCGSPVGDSNPHTDSPTYSYTFEPAIKTGRGVHKFFRSLPFFMSSGLSFLAMGILEFILYDDASPFYEPHGGKYDLDVLQYNLTRSTLLDIQQTVFVFALVFAGLGLLLLLFPTGKTPEEKPRMNILSLLLPPIAVIVTCMGIHTYNNVSLPPGAKEIIPQDELVFDFVEMHGDDIEFTQEFQDEIYDYYYAVGTAYNELLRDGDYDAFFDSVSVSSERFVNLQSELFDLEFGNLQDAHCLVNPSSVSKSQIPHESMHFCSLPIRSLIDPMYEASKNLGTMKNESDMVDYIMERVSVLLGLFYNEELFYWGNGGFPYPDTFFDGIDKSLTIDGIGNGNINIKYSEIDTIDFDINLIHKPATTDGFFSYSYKNSGIKGYGMIQFTPSSIIVNVTEDGDEYQVESARFDIKEY